MSICTPLHYINIRDIDNIGTRTLSAAKATSVTAHERSLIMRIIFNGLASHALQLLHDMEQSNGVNANCLAIFATMAEIMPELKTASFSGDVDLPGMPPKNSRNYLRPTMHIATNDDWISLQLESMAAEMSANGIFNTVVNLPKGEHGSLVIFPSSSIFKPQPDFRYNSLEFSERPYVTGGDKGTCMEIRVTHPLAEGAITVLEVRITENKKEYRGHAYRLALAIAKHVPDTRIIYYSPYDKDEGLEIVHKGWDWNKGNPRILIEDDYRCMAELEKELKPYKKLIMRYLRSKDMGKGCLAAACISDNLEDLYLKGVTNPILATNLAIVLGKANMSTVSTFLTEKEPDEQISEQVTKIIKTAEAIAYQRIGINWEIPGNTRIPSPTVVSETVLKMFEHWDNAAELKRINDEFAQQYPSAA